MTKIKKNKVMLEKEYHENLKHNEVVQKEQMEQEWSSVMHSTQKNMSEGALNIFRIQKSRNHWGNKQLWGSKEKGRNKPGHKTPKTIKK